MKPPPPPLSSKEFARRLTALEAEGKPATLRNIDPEFARWYVGDSAARIIILALGMAAVVTVLFVAVWRGLQCG